MPGFAGIGFKSPGRRTAIADFFNGRNRVSGDSFTSGPTTVADNLGALTTSPANVLAVQGGRLSYNLADGVTAVELNPLSNLNGWTDYLTSHTDATFTSTGIQGVVNPILTVGKTYTVAVAGSISAGVFSVNTANAAAPTAKVEKLAGFGTVTFVAEYPYLYLRNSVAATTAIASLSVKEVTPIWLPTAADGSQLWTSQNVRTRKGGVAKYDSTYLGWLNEPARTNLFLNSAAPVTQNITTTAQAYTVSVIGSGTITVSGTAAGVATEAAPLTVTAAAGTLTCTVAGTLTHGQVEAGAFKTSPITTTIAAVTRPATVYTRPTAGVLRSNDFGIWGRVVPSAAGQLAMSLFSLYVDSNNLVNVYTQSGTRVQIQKKVAGVSSFAWATYTHAAGTPFEFQAYQSRDGVGIRVKQDGGNWLAWTEGSDATSLLDIGIPATYQIGAQNNSAHFTGNFPFTAIIQHSDPKSQLEALAARYP